MLPFVRYAFWLCFGSGFFLVTYQSFPGIPITPQISWVTWKNTKQEIPPTKTQQPTCFSPWFFVLADFPRIFLHFPGFLFVFAQISLSVSPLSEGGESWPAPTAVAGHGAAPSWSEKLRSHRLGGIGELIVGFDECGPHEKFNGF